MGTIPQVAGAMQRILGPVAERAARATGLVRRVSKLNGARSVQTLVFGWMCQKWDYARRRGLSRTACNWPRCRSSGGQLGHDGGPTVLETLTALCQRDALAAPGYRPEVLALLLEWLRQNSDFSRPNRGCWGLKWGFVPIIRPIRGAEEPHCSKIVVLVGKEKTRIQATSEF